MKVEVSLEGLSFYSNHGFYEDERKAGNKFSVDVKVYTNLSEGSDFDQLNNTVNYETLYQIVKQEMGKPSHLLEDVVKRIIDEVFKNISAVESAEVSLSKYSPPIGGPCHKAKVTLKKTR
jgi:dihydroneopterin aldolase